MLLVSQFHFVYWYNIVLVVLTRSASSVDVVCMFSITAANFKRETVFAKCTVGRQTVVCTQPFLPPA